MIPATRWARRRRPALEPVDLEEATNRVGDLLVAVLADDQAEMRVRRERLVARIEPLGEPLRLGQGDRPVEPGSDDEARHLGQPAPVDRDPGEHLAASRTGLVRLL